MSSLNYFSKKTADHVTDEIASVLQSADQVFGFNELFEMTYTRLKKRNAVSGGEEMLRLRIYENFKI